MIGIAYFFIFASPTNFDLNYSIMSNTNVKREISFSFDSERKPLLSIQSNACIALLPFHGPFA
jgi:hypothetical protein